MPNGSTEGCNYSINTEQTCSKLVQVAVFSLSIGSKHVKGSKATIYWDTAKPAKSGGNPLCQATEQPFMCFRMPAFSL